MGYKVGISVVFDFKNDNIEFYGHRGITYVIKVNTFGFSYSSGVILNYENQAIMMDHLKIMELVASGV